MEVKWTVHLEYSLFFHPLLCLSRIYIRCNRGCQSNTQRVVYSSIIILFSPLVTLTTVWVWRGHPARQLHVAVRLEGDQSIAPRVAGYRGHAEQREIRGYALVTRRSQDPVGDWRLRQCVGRGRWYGRRWLGNALWHIVQCGIVILYSWSVLFGLLLFIFLIQFVYIVKFLRWFVRSFFFCQKLIWKLSL